MMLLIEHETKFTYSEPVHETVMEIRMSPLSNEDQTVMGFRLRTTPPTATTCYRDGCGNRVDQFNVLAAVREIAVRAVSYVRVHRRPARARLETVSAQRDEPPELEALEYLRPGSLAQPGPAVAAFVGGLPRPTGALADAVDRLIDAIRGRLKYEKKVTTARTPVEEALALGRGVCQDFTHLFLAAVRAWGVPARYVSGYVNQPGEIATHAWCQVWGGGAVGWVDVDPTQGTWVANDHVVTAVGRDFSDVPPNRGVWKGKAEELIAVTVNVQPAEALPPDWHDVAGPAWTAKLPRSRNQPRPGRGSLYRQQQSQQQQG
ncbi:MAG: transglutaminase domain-containing protein [Gemmataceae bacterium]